MSRRSRRGPARSILVLLGTLAFLVAAARPAAASIQIVNLDGPGEGLNDPTPVAPVGGNPGTTLGQQRMNVMQGVADAWSARVHSPVPILVGAQFDDLDCSATSATLGSTGPSTVVRDFTNAPRPGTWYVIAAANALAGTDLAPGTLDVNTHLSSRLGQPGCGFTFYYGLDGHPGAGEIDLFSVALHEMAHGLGFVALFDPVTGARLFGFDDAYLLNLLDNASGQPLLGMSDAARAAACRVPEQLHWTGASTTAASGFLTAGVGPAGHVHMYSPATYRPGSSVSHFSTSLTPNELMEPFYTGPTRDLDLTTALLDDVGWGDHAPLGPCVASSTALCLHDGRFRVEVDWNDFGSGGGSAHVVGQQTSDSGLFYFYGPDNWELVVKVLNACGAGGNSHYWVFAASATNLHYEIRVTDTSTGATRTYSNPLGVSSPAITDTQAFATCP